MKISISQALSFGYTAPFQHAIFVQILLSLVVIAAVFFYGALTFMSPVAAAVVVNLVGFWASVVVIRVALDIYDTGTSSFYRLIDAFARIPNIVAVSLTLSLMIGIPLGFGAGLIGLLGTEYSMALIANFTLPIAAVGVFLLVMLLVIIFRVAYAIFYVIDRGGWPFPAIKNSFVTTRGNVLRIIAGRFIAGLLMSVGFLLVGGLVFLVLFWAGLIAYSNVTALLQNHANITQIIYLVAFAPTLFFDVALYRQMSPQGIEVQ